jgi:peroxiredoxin
VLKSFADRQHITYPLLSDPDSKIIRAYDILNEAGYTDLEGDAPLRASRLSPWLIRYCGYPRVCL